MSQTSTRILLVALSVSILLFLRAHSQQGGVVVDRPYVSSHDEEYGLHSGRLIAEAAARDLAGAYMVDGKGVLLARQDDDSSTTEPTAAPTSPTATPTQPTSTPPPPPAPTTRTTTTPRTTTTQPPPPPPPVGGGTTTPPPSATESDTDSESSSATKSSTSTSSTSTNKSDDNGGGGFKKSTVIGVAVAGGIALAAIIAFIAWKVTRKRLSDFDGDGSEQIKWPELNNNDTHALPARPTGRSGIDSSPPRGHADLYSDAASHSTSDVHVPHDPYAVPAMPHMNPNQPYHDDPYGPQNGNGAYYDPYRGPVPSNFQGGPDPSGNGQWGMQGGEAIPMGTYNRTRSPGPAAAYGYDPNAAPAPRQASPGPNMAYGGQPQRHASPGPGAAYGGYPAQGQQYPQQGAYNPNNRAADDPYGGM